MSLYSKHQFQKHLSVIAALLLLSLSGVSYPRLDPNGKDFEMLVIGDSLVTGQGLNEEDKFYTLTKNWLETEHFAGLRKVNLKNKSHSGSRLFLAEDEIKALNKAEKDLDKFYHPEINFSFPSSKTQIDVAAREYKEEGKSPENIDLILVTGCLTNINSSYIIDPFKKNGKLRAKIDQYCNGMMFRFLEHASETFPNALITVVGYFPLVGNKSSTGKIYNTVLELYQFPQFTKPLMNNILTKQFFKPFHRRMNKRSRIWVADSDIALQTAVKRINEKYGEQKAVFVKSPLTEEQSFGTKNSLLFGVTKKGRSEDPKYDTRVKVCGKTIKSLKDVKLKFNIRFCELSGISHPNVEGSRAYANALRDELQTVLNKIANNN